MPFRWEVTRSTADDSLGRDYEWISDPTFTPDSQRLAYFAWTEEDNKKAVLVNGSEVVPWRPDAKGHPVFSADAQRIAFIAKRPDGFVAVLDGQEGRSTIGSGGSPSAPTADSRTRPGAARRPSP